MPVSYEALNRLFHTTWKTAFGELAPKGLASHCATRACKSALRTHTPWPFKNLLRE
jgi:hypothetical protein